MKELNEITINTTLYANHVDYLKMIDQIQNFISLARAPVRFIIFASRGDVFNYLKEKKSGEFRIIQKHFSNNIFVGQLTRKFGRKENNEIEGKFLLFKHNIKDIFIALTHEETDFFVKGLTRLIKSSYPYFTLPFFYSWEMEIMLNNLYKLTPQNQIMLTKFSWKARIKNQAARKGKESDLTWTDMPYKEVFKQINQNDAWIEKVYFDSVFESVKNGITNKTKVLSGFISRDGVFKCEHDFKPFYEAIIDKGVEIFSQRKEKLSNRARIKENNYESRPFFIEFDESIFKNKEQNYRLITVLKNLSHLSYSVVHANPYLHMTATDSLDNSNYDIWILSDNKITVAPQTVCSMSALNRLCDHISKEFREGLVKDIG